MSPQYPFLKYQLPALVWSLAIFGLSAIPRVPIDITPLGIDKVLHAVFYAILCFLVWRALWFQSRVGIFQRHSLLVAFLFSFGYGIVMEWYQRYLPGRSPDIYDAVANGTGALICVLVLMWRQKKGKRTI